MINIPIKYTVDKHIKVIENFLKQPNDSLWESKELDITSIKDFIKEYYIKEQDYICAYCQQSFKVNHKMTWDTEHILPKKDYPKFMFEPLNLCISCKDCNGFKGNKNVSTLNKKSKNYLKKEETDKVLIFHPHFDIYEKHLRKIQIGNLMHFIPRTLKGIKTINVCSLDRFIYFEIYDNNCELSPDKMKLINSFGSELQKCTNEIEAQSILMYLKDVMQELREKKKKEFFDKLVK